MQIFLAFAKTCDYSEIIPSAFTYKKILNFISRFSTISGTFFHFFTPFIPVLDYFSHFFSLLIFSAFSRKCCEGFSIVFFCVHRGVDENSDKKSGHELFFSLFLPPSWLRLSFSTSPPWCDCRLEKLEIIDFVCWFFRRTDVDHLGIHQPRDGVEKKKWKSIANRCQENVETEFFSVSNRDWYCTQFRSKVLLIHRLLSHDTCEKL